jgi:hypothetical protein
LDALFTKVICTFLKSVRKDGFFDAPFDLFKEKKSFQLLEVTMHFLRTQKVKIGRNRSKFRKTVFHKQIIDIHCPSKILCHTSKLLNFLKITRPYCRPISSRVTTSQFLYNFICVPKNYTFYKHFYYYRNRTETNRIYTVVIFLATQKSATLRGNPLELLEADEVLDPVNGGGLQDLVACELTHRLGGLLALLLGLADADEFVALAQEGRHALASVIGRHVERFSALQERKHILGETLKFGYHSPFFS